MEFTVAALLGRATRRVALYDVNLAQRGVFFLAIGQLAGQAHAVEHAFAARHFPRFASGFTGASGFDDFAAQNFGIVGALFEVLGKRFRHDVFDRGADFAGHQLVFGLAAELGFGHFDREHAAQAFAHVVATDFDFGFFGELVLLDVLANDAGHGGA